MASPDSPDPAAASGTAGQRLAAARSEWGVSVDEVAAYINLSAATIEALEADAHDKLPGLTFVKGYLRAYAKLLRLDADDIIARAGFAPERPKDIPVARVPLQRGRWRGNGERRRLARAAAAVIALVVLLCLGWAALRYLPTPGVERALQTLSLEAGGAGEAEGGADAGQNPPPAGAGAGAGAGDGAGDDAGAGAGDGAGDGAADGAGAGDSIDRAEEEDNALIIEDE